MDIKKKRGGGTRCHDALQTWGDIGRWLHCGPVRFGSALIGREALADTLSLYKARLPEDVSWFSDQRVAH